MLRLTKDELNYFKLIKEAKKLTPLSTSKKIKIAILSEYAIQHLVTLIKVLGIKANLNIEIYEGGYDTIQLDSMNPQSGLYQFQPDYIFFLHSTEKLKSKFFGCGHSKQDLLNTIVTQTTTMWEQIKSQSKATLIHSTYVLPLERTFGNYDRKIDSSIGEFFIELNRRLVAEAQAARHVLINDLDFTAGNVGRENWIDEKLYTLAKAPCSLDYLPRIAQGFLDIVVASTGHIVKCVILDLDNTLWGGVIGDDGLEGIRLGDLDEGEVFVSFQLFIRSLKERGIILAVCSKNEHSNAILPFQKHPHMVIKENDIAVFVANWNNKADNIKYIQKILNIGFDSMVFLDDNPFERNLVRELLPDVIVPELPEDPALYLRAIAELNLFETTTFSEADTQRSEQYRVESQREQLKGNFSSVDDYLKSLEMQIKLERFSPYSLPRVAQLIQRSNQFNLMTRRYSESDCERLANDKEGYFPFALSLADKFGDYGLISVVVLKNEKDEVQITEYLMSCRVLQRGVENFAMNAIFDYAKTLGAKRVTGKYIATSKNQMVKDFYRQFDFEMVEGDETNGVWSLSTDKYKYKPNFLSQKN